MRHRESVCVCEKILVHKKTKNAHVVSLFLYKKSDTLNFGSLSPTYPGAKTLKDFPILT